MSNIVIDENISAGSPTINGRRLTVFNVVSKIYYENNLESALKDHQISFKIAKEAVDYCRNLKCQEDDKLINFCSGCILRTLQEKWDFNKNEYSEVNFNAKGQNVSISIGKEIVFLGNL